MSRKQEPPVHQQESYEAGNKVEITGNDSSHQFEIGAVVTLLRLHEQKTAWRCTDDRGQEWWVFERDFKLVSSLNLDTVFGL